MKVHPGMFMKTKEGVVRCRASGAWGQAVGHESPECQGPGANEMTCPDSLIAIPESLVRGGLGLRVDEMSEFQILYSRVPNPKTDRI